MKKPNYLKGLRVRRCIAGQPAHVVASPDHARYFRGDGGVGSLPIRIGFIVRPDLLLGYLPGGRIARYYQPGFLYREEEKERSTQVQLS